MSNSRQPVLDGLKLDCVDAIAQAELRTLADGKRTVGIAAQRRILQFLASWKSDQCYMSLKRIASRIVMDERTVAATIRAMVAEGLILEWGGRNDRTRAVHWTEIGRRIPRAEGSGQSEANCPEGSGQSEANCPEGSGQSEVNCPEGSGQSEVNCPEGSGQSEVNCPDDQGTSALIHKDQENNSITSSSSQVRRQSPRTDDDDDESFRASVSRHSEWTPAREDEVAKAVKAAEVCVWQESIDSAKGFGAGPDDVLDALFVAMEHRDPRTGERLLGPGGFVTWARKGVFPCDNPPTAVELRERIAAAQQRQRAADQQRQRDADRIRELVREEAGKRSPVPSDQVVLAVTFGRLEKASLCDQARPEERNAYETLALATGDDHRRTGSAGSQRDARAAKHVRELGQDRPAAVAHEDRPRALALATGDDHRRTGSAGSQRDARAAKHVRELGQDHPAAVAHEDGPRALALATGDDHRRTGSAGSQGDARAFNCA